jgi:AcrR family transcriptional regulator
MPTVNPRQPDRRQRKSRTALQLALIRLISEKPYEAITIEDVTEAADVARATFYAHYKDKAALLAEANEQVISELTERVTEIAPLRPPVFTGAALAEIFEHAAAHKHLYLLVLRGEGGLVSRGQLVEAFERTGMQVFNTLGKAGRRKARVPVPLATKAFVGAMLATLEAWLAGDVAGSAEEVSATVLGEQLMGLEWSLGFDHGELQFRPPKRRG